MRASRSSASRALGIKPTVIVLSAAWVHCATSGFVCQAQAQEAALVIGTELGYRPYSFLDKSGKTAGCNVELTEAIAKVMQLDIEVMVGTWGEIRQALETGEIDATPPEDPSKEDRR